MKPSSTFAYAFKNNCYYTFTLRRRLIEILNDNARHIVHHGIVTRIIMQIRLQVLVEGSGPCKVLGIP